MTELDLLSKLHFDQLDFVGSGSYSSVYRLKGHEVVIKTVAEAAYAHHATEKSIYKRLGKHPSILSFFGETELSGMGELHKGLVFTYCSEGTLEDVLKCLPLAASQHEHRIQSVQQSIPL